jgi:nicotinic acid phosphoribosyltransferase
LTNDFDTLSSHGSAKSKPLNMVIKLASMNGKPCAKISDDSDKARTLASFLSYLCLIIFGLDRTLVTQKLSKG